MTMLYDTMFPEPRPTYGDSTHRETTGQHLDTPAADVARLTRRIEELLEQRDHWRREERLAWLSLERRDAEFVVLRRELAEVSALAGTLQRERDEARAWARRLRWRVQQYEALQTV